MRILFCHYVDEVYLGIPFLVRALEAFGHEVDIIKDEVGKPHLNKPYDVVIGLRFWQMFWNPFKAKWRFLWTGDSVFSYESFGLGDPRVNALISGLLCFSEWQKQTLCYASGYPLQGAHLLPYGIDLNEFNGHEERIRKRLMCVGPLPGEILPKIYMSLKEKHSDLELHVFPQPSCFDRDWSHFSEQKISMPDCIVRETVPQSQMAREFMRSAIFLYPCEFPPTYCDSVLAAQAAGCCVVTARLGALPEIVGDAGVLVEGGSDSYVAAVDKLLSDDESFHTLSKKALKHSQQHDWKNRASQFIEWITHL